MVWNIFFYLSILIFFFWTIGNGVSKSDLEGGWFFEGKLVKIKYSNEIRFNYFFKKVGGFPTEGIFFNDKSKYFFFIFNN